MKNQLSAIKALFRFKMCIRDRYTESQRTNLRKGVIGFVFQSFNLIDELNVYENIDLPLLYMGISASERKKRVETAMERMAITRCV